jgi:hypothetical protein
MPNFAGQPTEINRMLGYLDEDDPSHVPVGMASLCRNCDFSYTSVKTRNGVNLTMAGKYKSPVTGIFGTVYTPQTDAPADVMFQLPVIAQLKGLGGTQGTLQYESPLGTGRMNEFAYNALFKPPVSSHALGSQAYNRLYNSWSNLINPLSMCSVLDLKTKTIDPYGQKPFGWAWIALTAVLANEMATPSQIQNGSTVSVGNGHTYQAQNNGVTGPVQPIWPLTEGGIIVEVLSPAQIAAGLTPVTWKELTMVLANRVPPPIAPALTRDGGAGGFAANRDVYIVTTFINGIGETIASVSSKLVNTVANDAVQVAIPALASLPGWVQGLQAPYAITGAQVYESDVATSAAAPPLTDYQSVAGGPYALGSVVTVTNTSSSGIYSPTINYARITPGMIPNPVVSPAIARDSTAGAFPAGRDVYIAQTYINANGETQIGPTDNSIVDTQLNDAITVTILGLDGYILTGVNIYEADVPTGTPAPNPDQFALVGTFQPGATATVTAAASGPPAPLANTTGPGGNIAADTPAGGLNATQGYRYAVCSFQNRNGSNSGITSGSVVQYIVDEDGFELALFNVATGPLNISKRLIGFAVADGVPAGPYGFLAQSQVSDGIQVLASVINDNVTTQTVVNFTDDQLLAAIASGDQLTSYFDTIWPYQCVDLYYSASTNRFFQTGMPGLSSSHAVSQAGDAETYQGSTCIITVGEDDGERCICVREFTNGTIFSLRERSGFIISPSSANPIEWNVQRQWSKFGPCGPRAVDVAGDFLIFIHRSGVYRYSSNPDAEGEPTGTPVLLTKEIPYWWQTINWAAQQTIWCTIDVEKRVVRCGFPINGSAVPNQELTISYVEGWNYPIHFSTYSGKMIAVDACRKISINDIAAFCAARIERALPAPPQPPHGVDGVEQTGGDYYQSQFLYGSSGPDGSVQAITPGVYFDNGAGIDWHYRSVSTGAMQSLSKFEGFNLNARGNGSINATALSGRDMLTDWTPGAPTTRAIKMRPFTLDPGQSAGISRFAESRVNEHWMIEFDNGRVPGAWCELKDLVTYTIPMYNARDGGEG